MTPSILTGPSAEPIAEGDVFAKRLITPPKRNDKLKSKLIDSFRMMIKLSYVVTNAVLGSLSRISDKSLSIEDDGWLVSVLCVHSCSDLDDILEAELLENI